MKRSTFLWFFLVYLLALYSCAGPMYPVLTPNPLRPRVIQPIPSNGNVNAIPENSNFIQSYSKYKKSKVNSTKFGALVRIIEFEYDITDSLTILPRLTTGFDEGEMTGLITILLDQYELSYEDKHPQIREYVEEVSYESTSASRMQPSNARQAEVKNRSQIYNATRFTLENEDANLILRSKTLTYIIHLENCELAIYPTKEQLRILKRMIKKHFTPMQF